MPITEFAFTVFLPATGRPIGGGLWTSTTPRDPEAFLEAAWLWAEATWPTYDLHVEQIEVADYLAQAPA